MTVLLVPRWSGDASNDWYPWLSEQVPLTVSPLLPAKQAPEIEPSVSALLPQIHERARLVGHSVGCQVVMRALARADVVVDAVVLVAAWWTVDDPWDSLRPWIEKPFDHERARLAARRIDVLISDDDPFTRDFATTRRLFEERLAAQVTVVQGAAHFNIARADAVLARLTLD